MPATTSTRRAASSSGTVKHQPQNLIDDPVADTGAGAVATTAAQNVMIKHRRYADAPVSYVSLTEAVQGCFGR